MKFPKEPKEGGEGGGLEYFKIKDGETIRGIFYGEPVDFQARWENGRTIVTNDSDPDGRFKFRINVIIREGNDYKAKVWEQGTRVYNTLKELNEDYPLDQTVVKIKREGNGKQTSYSILPDPKAPMTPQLREILAKVELHDLKKGLTTQEEAYGQETDSDWPPEASMDEEIPF